VGSNPTAVNFHMPAAEIQRRSAMGHIRKATERDKDR